MGQRQNYRSPPREEQRQEESNGNGGGKKPEQVFKYGASGGGFVEAAVWAKDLKGDNGSYTVYSVSCHRSYYDDKAKEWRQNSSVRHQDVPLLCHALHEAWAWILATKANQPTS